MAVAMSSAPNEAANLLGLPLELQEIRIQHLLPEDPRTENNNMYPWKSWAHEGDGGIDWDWEDRPFLRSGKWRGRELPDPATEDELQDDDQKRDYDEDDDERSDRAECDDLGRDDEKIEDQAGDNMALMRTNKYFNHILRRMLYTPEIGIRIDQHYLQPHVGGRTVSRPAKATDCSHSLGKRIENLNLRKVFIEIEISGDPRRFEYNHLRWRLKSVISSLKKCASIRAIDISFEGPFWGRTNREG